MIKYIKNQLKNIPMMILICILFYGIVTIATSSINSNDITFDNTNSNLNAGDMQEAIDEVFQHATDYNEIKTTIGDSTLTTTNKTLSGGINEINGNMQDLIIAKSFGKSGNSGSGNKTFTVTIPEGYNILSRYPLELFASGNDKLKVNDTSMVQSGTTVTITAFIFNPESTTNYNLYGSFLLIKSGINTYNKDGNK